MTPEGRRAGRYRATAPAMLAVVAWLATSVLGPSAALALVPLAAVPDDYSVRHDQVLNVAAPGVLKNDVGILGTGTAVFYSGPSHGSLTLNANGSFMYTPATGYVGQDTFRYRLRDGILTTLPATVTITITNAVPVAYDETYTAETNVELSVPAPGVLANDTDADGDGLTVEFSDTGGTGSMHTNPNGSFTFDSGGGFEGDRTFDYQVTDGIVWSNVATLTIRVSKSPAPTAAPTVRPTPTPAPTPTAGPLPTLPIPTLALPTLPPLPTLVPSLPPLPTLPAPTVSPLPTIPPILPGVTPSPSSAPGAPTATPGAGQSPSVEASTPPGAPGSTTDPGGPGAGQPPAVPGGFVLGGAPGGGKGSAPVDGIGEVVTGALGLLPGGFLAWSYPALVMTVPGILLLIVIGAQALGAFAWLPVVRRRLGGFGAVRRFDRAGNRPLP